MKRKFFLGAGAAILVAAAAFAGRASAKFGEAGGFYVTAPGSAACLAISSSPVSSLLVTGAGTNRNDQAQLITAKSGTAANIYATSTCVRKVFFTY